MFRALLLIALWYAAPAMATLEDPTRPPNASAVATNPVVKRTSAPRWVLSSTLISPQRRSAVINSRVVSRGDRVAGATVVEIRPSRVRLRYQGRDITLAMLNKNIKTPSTQPARQQGK